MTDDRLMVADAVLAGLIGEEHLTQDELDELYEILCEASTEELMKEAEDRGCIVFDSVDTLQ